MVKIIIKHSTVNVWILNKFGFRTYGLCSVARRSEIGQLFDSRTSNCPSECGWKFYCYKLNAIAIAFGLKVQICVLIPNARKFWIWLCFDFGRLEFGHPLYYCTVKCWNLNIRNWENAEIRTFWVSQFGKKLEHSWIFYFLLKRSSLVWISDVFGCLGMGQMSNVRNPNLFKFRTFTVWFHLASENNTYKLK